MKSYPVLPTLILTALAAGSLWQSALAEEPRRSPATPPALIPFEVFAKHREALGLSDDQVRELGRITEGMADAAKKLEAERRERTEALQEALAQRPIELEKAMARFQAVLKAENEIKALQFRSGVAAQNLLTPEQAARVQAIASKDRGSRKDEASAVDPGAVREKLEQLKGELRKKSGGELSKEAVATLERVEQAAQKGNLDEAKKHVEGLLAQLGNKGDAPRKGKEGSGSGQPSASELKELASQTKARLAETSDPEKREQLQQQLAKLHAMQERLADASAGDRPEKGAFKADGENKQKGKQADHPEKGPVKAEGEAKEKGKQPDGGEKGAVKGEGEAKEKGKFDKNAESPKRPDPELRKRVEAALGEFQEAKAAGNRDAMEKITHSIESLLRESARESGTKDGPRKEDGPKDGARKDGAAKEGSAKDGTSKDGASKEGFRKDAAKE
jgi:Spy/CpxP family protein refolding chaperone